MLWTLSTFVKHILLELKINIKAHIIFLWSETIKHNSQSRRLGRAGRGVQYCSHAYVNLLQKNNIKSSMTQTGDPLENAVAERINKTIKEEFTNDKQINFINIVEAKAEIKKFIEFYNNKRPHRSIEWLTPNQAHQQSGELNRVWKSYSKAKQGGDLAKA